MEGEEKVMMEIAIKTSELTKSYAVIQAINGLNLQVNKGSIYGFLGRNGAGKTTTIGNVV
jgi:ABC-2 type transport system ATP-binding protein